MITSAPLRRFTQDILSVNFLLLGFSGKHHYVICISEIKTNLLDLCQELETTDFQQTHRLLLFRRKEGHMVPGGATAKPCVSSDRIYAWSGITPHPNTRTHTCTAFINITTPGMGAVARLLRRQQGSCCLCMLLYVGVEGGFSAIPALKKGNLCASCGNI